MYWFNTFTHIHLQIHGLYSATCSDSVCFMVAFMLGFLAFIMTLVQSMLHLVYALMLPLVGFDGLFLNLV